MRTVCGNRQLAALGYVRFFLLLFLALLPIWSTAATRHLNSADVRKLRAIYLERHKYLTRNRHRSASASVTVS